MQRQQCAIVLLCITSEAFLELLQHSLALATIMELPNPHSKAKLEGGTHLLLASVRTSILLPLPIQATCSGSGSRELRMTLGVPSIRVSSETQFQLDCDCSVWCTCTQIASDRRLLGMLSSAA